MAVERSTETELPLLLGAFKPVGHVVVCVGSDEEAHRMADALEADGFAGEAIQIFPAKVMAEELADLLPDASGVAGFGWELQSMREYLDLAREGCGWLLVRAQDDEQEQRVAEIARRHGARLANKYNLLTVEELL